MSESIDTDQSTLEHAEAANYMFQTRDFRPVSIVLPGTPRAGHYKLDFRDWFMQRKIQSMARFDVNDCRAFCWKDCIIYGGPAERDIGFAEQLMNDVWREWWPSRAMDKDVYDDSFFARNLCFDPPAESLSKISTFHAVFCETLRKLEAQMPGETPPNAFSRSGPGSSIVSGYRLRATFPEVFIVLRGDRDETGVLVCWLDKDVASKYDIGQGTSTSKNTTAAMEQYLELDM